MEYIITYDKIIANVENNYHVDKHESILK